MIKGFQTLNPAEVEAVRNFRGYSTIICLEKSQRERSANMS